MASHDNKPSASTKQWANFFSRCFQERIRLEKFERFIKLLQQKHPLAGHSKLEALFTTQTTSYGSGSLDPLLPLYIDCLLHHSQAEIKDVLSALLKCTRENQPDTNAYADLEAAVFEALSRFCAGNATVLSLNEARATVRVLSTWLSTIADANAASMMDGMTTMTPAMLQGRENLGILLLTLTENPKIDKLLRLPPPQHSVKLFAQPLVNFIELLASSSMQVANRLDMFQKAYESLRVGPSVEDFGDGEDEKLAMGQMQISNIMEGPQIHSRAAVAVWLDGLASGPPLISDALLLNHLQSRYKDDAQSLVSDLITAAFDVIAIAINRGDQADTTFLLRSLVVNKLPLLMLGSFAPLGYEFAVSQALERLDPRLFQSFAQGIDAGSGGNVLSDVRRDFLFSCVLHGLIAEPSIERLLGEHPMQKDTQSGKLMKGNLVAECAVNPQKVEQLVDSIEKMDGNAGTAVDAVTEVLHGLCANKDTMSLKALSNQLSRRPFSLDVILLFQGPALFLRPLCQLLNDWAYDDDDQGEHQPVYDEFSACLLLVMAFVHRFKLSKEDLGLASGQTFVEKLIDGEARSLATDTMSETQSKQFSGWIRGLFETEGISDEQMSNCPPQDFYLLVPTIFKQSILARKSNAMKLETLKSGLELLLEPFLLPCLVVAIQWLMNHTWERHGDTDVILIVLQKLIRPASLHGEALAMHTTILSIVGKPLTATLKDLQQQTSPNKDIDSLLEKLQPHLTYCRGGEISHAELHLWSANFGGGMLMGIKNCVNALCYWSSPAGVGSTLPNYSYWQLDATVRLTGAFQVLRVIVEEVKAQHQTGIGDLALDVAASLICASSLREMALVVCNGAMAAPTTAKVRLGLREALQVELEDAAKTIVKDPLRGEIIVRLGRSVERQLASVSVTDLQMGMPDMMQTIDLGPTEAMGGPELAADDMTAVGGSSAGLDLPEVTNEALQLDMDAAVAEQNNAGNFDDVLGSANDDDIFGGLTLDADMEF